MPRGGKREPKDGKKLGRPAKPKPDLPTNLDRGIATRILERAKVEETYVAVMAAAITDKNPELWFRMAQYAWDRSAGKPAQSIITSDNRENSRELSFGDLPMPASPQSGAAGKPN